MDEYQNLRTHLTNTDKFDIKHIDIENITNKKNIYGIYNNTIKEPYHNFWFLADNCKFLKIYENKNNSHSLVFSLNTKYEQHRNILSVINNILEHIKNTCIPIYEKINYTLPWNNNENFPASLYFRYNNESLYLNNNNDDLDINSITFNNNNNYTILFEIKYFVINENKIKLEFFAKLIKLEKNFELKNSFLNLSKKIKTIVIEDEIKTPYRTNINSNKTDNTEIAKPIFPINNNMLLETLNKLNKTKNILDIDNNNNNNSNNNGTNYLENKIQLKKTITNKDKDDYFNIIKKNYLEDKKKRSELIMGDNLQNNIKNNNEMDNEINNNINGEIDSEINNEIINNEKKKKKKIIKVAKKKII